MAARRPNAPNDIDRPFNNLLRRLSASDFGLIAPHLAREVAKANDLLYTLMARVTDQFTNEGIGKLIEQMKAQKAALHFSKRR